MLYWYVGSLEMLHQSKVVSREDTLPLPYFPLQNSAKRMVAFWAMRRKSCGEAAFLPLVATGHGALNAEAIAMLNNGYGVRLQDDLEGRTVLFIDRSRFQHGSPFRNSMLQLLLYLFCVMLEEEDTAQKKGFVLVVNGKVRRC
jgi:hypothetical protein